MIATNSIVIPPPDRVRSWAGFLNSLNSEHNQDDSIIKFQNQIVEGFVRQIKVEPDIYIRTWQVSATNEQVFTKKKWNNSSIVVSLLYIFNPEFFFLRADSYGLQLNKPDAPALILIPSAASARFEISSYHTVQLLEIGLTQEFFQHWQAGHFLLSMDVPFPVIRLNMCSLVVADYVHQLYDACLQPVAEQEKIRCLLQPLTEILRNDFSNQPKNSTADSTGNISKMEIVEQQIMNSLRQPLPSLTEIARQANISEASLKRHFKMAFGQGIYQYYLFRKMQLAKMVLEEGGISVNSLAEEMGYKNVSHFITLFKKHHGYAPGTVIRHKRVNPGSTV